RLPTRAEATHSRSYHRRLVNARPHRPQPTASANDFTRLPILPEPTHSPSCTIGGWSVRAGTAHKYRVSKRRVKAWLYGCAFYAAIVACSTTGRIELHASSAFPDNR